MNYPEFHKTHQFRSAVFYLRLALTVIFFFLLFSRYGYLPQDNPSLFATGIFFGVLFFLVQVILAFQEPTEAPSPWHYLSLLSGTGILTYVVFISGGYRSEFMFIYLIPPLTYSLQFGAGFGLLSFTLNSAAILTFIFYVQRETGLGSEGHLIASLTIISLMFLTTQFGAYTRNKEKAYREQLVHLAERDELTGLYNFRSFNSYLSAQQKAAAKTKNPLSLIFADIDNLRNYNGMLGYLAGNNLVVQVAAVISSTVGDRGSVFRYGGGHFAIIVPGTEKESAAHLSGEIRKAVENMVVAGAERQPGGKVTVTTGVAAFPEDDLQELVQVAAAALDQGKTAKHKEEEEYLQRSEKLALVGQLAAGLAHEIRNPLTTVKGFCQLVKGQSLTEKGREYVEVILTELERVNVLVKEFLLLTKPAAPRMELVKLKGFLEDVVYLMTSEALLHDVTIRMYLADDLPDITADAEQLKQVAINLTLNAIEAMPGGGTLQVKAYPTQDLKEVVLEFQDTGTGIPEDKVKHIFEPFFSTKEEGTGLGLSITLRIVENHGGSIHVTSQYGQGTTFVVRLPVQYNNHNPVRATSAA